MILITLSVSVTKWINRINKDQLLPQNKELPGLPRIRINFLYFEELSHVPLVNGMEPNIRQSQKNLILY